MLKQGLELKQTQKLSPLQIQTIKLIELPIQDLEQRIRKEIEENPVLDEEQPAEMPVDVAPAQPAQEQITPQEEAAMHAASEEEPALKLEDFIIQ